jgi:predicted ATP-dependent serine protease
MGKFTGWDVKAKTSHKCNNCGMEKEKKQGCCNDEQATIRLKKDQLASTINDVPGNQIIYIQHQYPSLIQPVLTSDNDVLQSIHGPPLIQAISPVILHCVFRI